MVVPSPVGRRTLLDFRNGSSYMTSRGETLSVTDDPNFTGNLGYKLKPGPPCAFGAVVVIVVVYVSEFMEPLQEAP